MPRRQRLHSLVITGTAGSGKSTLMAALEERLGWPALEGDALHPAGNVAKMTAGTPLTDADREPWLRAIAAWIGEREAERRSSIVTCSGLKRRYRDVLRAGHPWVWFVQLEVPREVLESRVAQRMGHFMPPSMVESQLADLEPLQRDEPGMMLPALAPPTTLAGAIVERLQLDR